MRNNHKYLIPSKKKRFLDILQIVKNHSRVSQHGISKMIKVSSAIVNKYLLELINEGYVITKEISGNQLDYSLSKSGNALYQRMTLDYHAELVRYYSEIKKVIINNIKDRLTDCNRIGIFGAAETGELVSNLMDAFGKKIICAFDNDTQKHSSIFYGLQVYSPSEITRIKPEALIITSIGYQEEIYLQLTNELGYKPEAIVRTIH